MDERLQRLREELEDHGRIAGHLGLDLDRPLRSLGDGYPENAIALVGKLTEKLLKELWRHQGVEGDPSGRALNDLVKRCQPHIRSSIVLNALDDIRRLRNRSTHDGYQISDEDGLLAIRRLVDVLAWFTNTGSPALVGADPAMDPRVADRCEFLAGIYVTLGYRQAKRFVLTTDTVYQLFCREAGMRVEYVELMVSRDADDLREVIGSTGGELLRTKLPKVTRFVVLDGADPASDFPASLQEMLGGDCRIVGYDAFVGTFIDLDDHLATAFAPGHGPAEKEAISAALLSTDPLSGAATAGSTQDAVELLARLAGESANVLIIGRPGSGKTWLLRTLAAEHAEHRFRFCFDLGLKRRGESFPEYVARVLAPSMRVDRSSAYELFLYLVRSGSALCLLDAVDEGVNEPSTEGFLQLFADLAPVLSAESAVVMSSRVSFVADSPPIRQLLDSGSPRSERLVEQMYANGVDPTRVPHFHIVRLTTARETRLERQLASSLHSEATLPLGALIGDHLKATLTERGSGEIGRRLPGFFGRAFLEQGGFKFRDGAAGRVVTGWGA